MTCSLLPFACNSVINTHAAFRFHNSLCGGGCVTCPPLPFAYNSVINKLKVFRFCNSLYRGGSVTCLLIKWTLHLKTSPGSIPKILPSFHRVNPAIVYLILWSEGEVVAIAKLRKQDQERHCGPAFLIWQRNQRLELMTPWTTDLVKPRDWPTAWSIQSVDNVLMFKRLCLLCQLNPTMTIGNTISLQVRAVARTGQR